MLVGGLPVQMITEITGLPAAGKTQLCNTIAINLAQFNGIGTLFFDCKGDFSGSRTFKMLEAQKRPDEEITMVMSQIKVQQVWDALGLIELLTELLEDTETFPSYRLLIVDSMPALWFLMHGDTCNTGRRRSNPMDLVYSIIKSCYLQAINCWRKQQC